LLKKQQQYWNKIPFSVPQKELFFRVHYDNPYIPRLSCCFFHPYQNGVWG